MSEVTACPKDFDLERLQPILVAGDTFQGILSAEYIPEQFKKVPIGILYRLGFQDILKLVLPKYQRGCIELINYDRPSRSPRITIDENITFVSLQLLLQHGLSQRCYRVYQSWRAEKTRDDQILQRRGNDAIAAGKRQLKAVGVRIKDGIMRWLVEQAVARYPCVFKSRIYAKIDALAAGL